MARNSTTDYTTQQTILSLRSGSSGLCLYCIGGELRISYIGVADYNTTLASLVDGTQYNICMERGDDSNVRVYVAGTLASAAASISSKSASSPPPVGAYSASRVPTTTSLAKMSISGASAVISNNLDRKDKSLFTDREGGSPIRFLEAENDREEAQFVVRNILVGNRNEDVPFGHQAILYRTNAQSRVFEEELLKYDVPYTIVGGQRFYERAEIKDVLCYLRLLVNPKDDAALVWAICRTFLRGLVIHERFVDDPRALTPMVERFADIVAPHLETIPSQEPQ